MSRHARPGRSDRRSVPVLALVVAGSALFALPAAVALSPARVDQRDVVPLAGLSRPAAYTATAAVEETQPPRAVPQRVVIEALGIDAAVEHVGLTRNGALAPPSDPSRVGWYTQSSPPGELGPAVFVGHVDSREGPAIFARLGELDAGDVVTVESGDGSTISYVVSSVSRYPKESFPTETVYGGSPEPSLRLITCAGPYQRGMGYADNVVVSARTGDG